MRKNLLLLVCSLFAGQLLLGQVWSPKAAGVLPASVNVFDVSEVNPQIIWAVGGHWDSNGPFASDVPTVLRSTDGGETWVSKPIAGAKGRYSYDIHAFDANTAVVTTQDLNTGPGRGIFRTTDGGDTWTETLHHVAGGVWVHFFDGSEGVCINARNIARTNDAGEHWMASTIPGFQTNEGNILNNAATSLATLGDHLWFGTWKGRVFHSGDRGKNWQVFASGLGSLAIFLSIDFVDEQTGMAIYYFEATPTVYHLARTTDGGQHWTAIPNAPIFSEIAALPCSRTFVGVKWWNPGKGTFSSTDLGETWTTEDDSLEVWAPVFSAADHGWAATATATGANPALYKWSGGQRFGRTFVNQAATGANNGKTWADAFTDLQTALAAAKTGDEIWVAEGTYKPDTAGGSQTATFSISKDLRLFGGFAGTECLLSERDIALHPTVLSGDLNGDDVDTSFAQNRADNVLHVVRVSASVTGASVFDGFTIRGGHADGSGVNGDGGGMTCSGNPHIRACTFERNFAKAVGGGLNTGNAKGLVVEGCTFRENEATEGGGIFTGDQFTIENCQFIGNATHETNFEPHGAGVYATNPNGASVRRCLFSENTSVFTSAGMLIWTTSASTSASVTVADCVFENNTAHDFAGGLNLIPWGDNTHFRVERCRFQNNKANDGGGLEIYVNTASSGAKISVDSCQFFQNSASNNGGGIWTETNGKNMSLNFRNCHFSENTAGTECGAADFWSTNGATGTLTVDSCLFEKNTALVAGGIEMGNGWGNLSTAVNYQLKNSVFRENHATLWTGAALFWTDAKSKANFNIENCFVDGNISEDKASGFAFASLSKDFHATVSRCRIVGNSAVGDGGAVHGSGGIIPNTPLPTTASVLFENCLLAGNTGAGPAIVADSLPNLKFQNCTIAQNSGGGISLTDQSGLLLQNTILFQNGPAELAADATSKITSQGGNLLDDGSLAGAATPWDLQSTDPLFAAPGDFHLSNASPGIDKGVDLGNLSATDLDGNPRVVACPDIGAFESAVVVSANCVVSSGEAVSAASLRLSPNPAGDFLTLEFSGELAVQAFDPAGKLVLEKRLATGQTLDLQGLAPGIYLLRAEADERVFAGKFVKR